MQREKFGWQSSDNLQLYGQMWKPESKPKAVVCLLHGLGEHSGRYQHVADTLTRAGYAVSTFDLRGHGRSGGPRGHSPSLDAILSDIDSLVEKTQDHYQDLPVFMYGHSLGGILALVYAVSRKPAFSGVVSTSPALHSSLAEQKLKVLFIRITGSLFPNLTIPTGLNAADISHDPAVIDAYLKDPLVHDKVTTGLGKVMIQAIDYAFSNAQRFPLPLLIMGGSEDNLAYPSGYQEFASRVPRDYDLRIWEGKKHEIHNEYGKEDVLAYLLEWMAKVVPMNAPGQSRSDMGKFQPV